MILRAYSLQDVKALQYHAPFFAPTDAAAIRMVQDLVNDMQNMVGKHPSDFKLFAVGSYDDANGHFEPVFPLVHIIDAINLVPVAPPSMFDLAPRRDDARPLNGSAEAQRQE